MWTDWLFKITGAVIAYGWCINAMLMFVLLRDVLRERHSPD
jgi:hypothetical protein